jgi:hypothetical protein
MPSTALAPNTMPMTPVTSRSFMATALLSGALRSRRACQFLGSLSLTCPVCANLDDSSRQSARSDLQSCLHIGSIRLVDPARVEALAAWVDGTADETARGAAADTETELLSWLPPSTFALSAVRADMATSPRYTGRCASIVSSRRSRTNGGSSSAPCRVSSSRNRTWRWAPSI